MRLYLFLLCFFSQANSYAQVEAVEQENNQEQTTSPLDTTTVYVDAAHQKVSDTILLLSNRIDSFFGSRRGDDEANGSRLRIYYDSTFLQNQKWDDRVEVRFSLRLPQLQKLLKVSLNREGGEDKAPSKDTASKTKEKPSLKDLIVTTKKWTFNFNTGLRVDFPPNLFARARLRRTFIFFNQVEFNPTQEATWFQNQGFGLNFSHDLDYQLAPDLLFRIVNSAFWLDDTDEVTTAHGPVLFQQLSRNRAISYSLQALGTNRPKLFINNYVASIQYRQLIHSNWLFLEVRPAIDFPKQQQWNEVYSLFFRVEAVFGSL